MHLFHPRLPTLLTSPLVKHYASSRVPLHEKYLVQLLTAGTQAYAKIPRVNSIETLSGVIPPLYFHVNCHPTVCNGRTSALTVLHKVL